MIVDGGPAPREDLEAAGHPSSLQATRADLPADEKPCGCHPHMPDIRVPGGYECLGCGWGVLRRYEGD